MPTFVVLNHLGFFMRVCPDLGIVWVQQDFNEYPSKYAAKRHLKELDNVPEDAKIVPLLTE